ncbi:MAG: hypothetical protein RL219_275, partial [Actinomycetota bacterium]
MLYQLSHVRVGAVRIAAASG